MDLSSSPLRQWHLAVIVAVMYCYTAFVFNVLLQKCGLNFPNYVSKTVLDFILKTVFNYILFQLLQSYKLYERSVVDASVQVDTTEDSLKMGNEFHFDKACEDISSSGLCEHLVQSPSSSEDINIKKYNEHLETPKLSFDLDLSSSLLKPKQILIKRRYSFPLRLSRKFNSTEMSSNDLLGGQGRQNLEKSKLAYENKSPQNKVIPLVDEMRKGIKECVDKLSKIEEHLLRKTDVLKIADNLTECKDSPNTLANYDGASLQKKNFNIVETETFMNSASTSKLERDMKYSARPSRHSTPMLSDGIQESEFKLKYALVTTEHLICENCKNEGIGQPVIRLNGKNVVKDGSTSDISVVEKASKVSEISSCHDLSKIFSPLYDIETAQDRIEYDKTCPVIQKQPKPQFRFPFKRSVTLQNMGSPISYSGDYEVDPFTMLHKTMKNLKNIPDESDKPVTEVLQSVNTNIKDDLPVSSGNVPNKISRGITLNPSDLEKQFQEFPQNLDNCLSLLSKKKSVSDPNNSNEINDSSNLQPPKADKHKYRSTSLPHLHSKMTLNFPKSTVKEKWHDIVSTVTKLMKKYQQPGASYPFKQDDEQSIFDFTQQNYEEIANGIIKDHPKSRKYLFHLDDEIPTGSAQDISFGSFVVLDSPVVDEVLKPRSSARNLSRSNVRSIAESVSDDKVLESLDLENVSKVYSLISESLGTSTSKSEGSVEESGGLLAKLQKNYSKWKSAPREKEYRGQNLLSKNLD